MTMATMYQSIPGSGGMYQMPQRKMGMLRISYEYLHKLLDMPEDARIIRVGQGSFNDHGSFGIVIESPLMPTIIEGATIPNVTIEEIKGWDM